MGLHKVKKVLWQAGSRVSYRVTAHTDTVNLLSHRYCEFIRYRYCELIQLTVHTRRVNPRTDIMDWAKSTELLLTNMVETDNGALWSTDALCRMQHWLKHANFGVVAVPASCPANWQTASQQHIPNRLGWASR